jgi:hypothetical protein
MIKIGSTEFENISRLLLKQSYSPIETAKEVLTVAGADLNELHEMSLGDLKNVWLEWNEEADVEKGLRRTIEIDGYIYEAYKGDEFILNSRDLGLIQSIVNKREGEANFWHLILAVIFKREDLTRAEHYDDAHIKQKGKLILEHGFTSELVIPYIALITQEMAEFARESIQTKKQEVERAKELERNNG